MTTLSLARGLKGNRGERVQAQPLAAKPQRTQSVDHVLLTIILVLTVIGVVTVYSASSERSIAHYGSAHAMFMRQMVFALSGIGIMAFTAWMPYRFWRKFGIPAVAVSGFLLLLVFIGSLGHSSHGAQRWLTLGPVRFQPSELAKFSVILFIASWAYLRGERMKTAGSGLLIPLGVAGLLAGMIALQPDFSTFALIMLIALVMVFIAGARLSHLVILVVPLSMLAAMIAWMEPYRRARLMSFLSPMADPDAAGYQILQSWIGFGRGGLFGVGAGSSRQKLFFLPDSYTDFIYSVVGEEWGFVGAAILVALFLALIWRGLRIGLRCPDPFGGYLAVGFTFAVGLYALINMGIAVGVLPTTGLPLPFVSYGGTSLLMTYAAMGVVLSISRYGYARVPGQRNSGENS